MPRYRQLSNRQILDTDLGIEYDPKDQHLKKLSRHALQTGDTSLAEILMKDGASEAKVRAQTHKTKEKEVRRSVPSNGNVYTNENVINTESDVLNLFIPELNARQSNQRNTGVDVMTDIGPIDIQYFTQPGLPFVDLVSAGNFGPGRRRLSDDQIYQVNQSIRNDIRDGANLVDVMDALESNRNFVMHKAGKLLNTYEYPAVASVLRNEGSNLISAPQVIDLAGLANAANTRPLRDLGLGVRFNQKDGKHYAKNDTHESAFVTLSPKIAREFDITNDYFV